jgi:histone H3/H4
VPGILNSGTVVVTEGHEKSFDSLFFRWLLDDNKVEVFPCGNCHDVSQVVRKAGLWAQISTDITMSGVIDADFRSPSQIEELTTEGVVPLPLHEAESFICMPSVIASAARAIGSQEPLLTENDAEEIILQRLADARLQIALRRCFSHSTFTVRMSFERSVLATVTSKEEAMVHVRTKSADEVGKAIEAMSEDVFEHRLDDALSEIDRAIQNRDIQNALRLLAGKELLAALAPKAGCKNGTDLMRSIKRNLCVDDHAELTEFRDQLRKCLAQPCHATDG